MHSWKWCAKQSHTWVGGYSRLARLWSCQKAMGRCTAQLKMLLFRTKTIVRDWVELSCLKKNNLHILRAPGLVLSRWLYYPMILVASELSGSRMFSSVNDSTRILLMILLLTTAGVDPYVVIQFEQVWKTTPNLQHVGWASLARRLATGSVELFNTQLCHLVCHPTKS